MRNRNMMCHSWPVWKTFLFIFCVQLNCMVLFFTVHNSTLNFLTVSFFISSIVTECDLLSIEMNDVKLICLSLSLSSTELYSRQQSGSVCGGVSHHPSSEYPLTNVFVPVCFMCWHKLKQGAKCKLSRTATTLCKMSKAHCGNRFLYFFFWLHKSQLVYVWNSIQICCLLPLFSQHENLSSVCISHREIVCWTEQTDYTKTRHCPPLTLAPCLICSKINPWW